MRTVSTVNGKIISSVYWSFDQTNENVATYEIGDRKLRKPLVMFGIEVNYAILLRRRNNWFHTRWNISHSAPDFDSAQRFDATVQGSIDILT